MISQSSFMIKIKCVVILFVLLNSVFVYGQAGALDTTFNRNDIGYQYGDGPNHFVSSVAIRSDGLIMLGGGFNIYSGIGSGGVATVNVNGSSFFTHPFADFPNNPVNTLAIQPDTKTLVGGSFTGYGKSKKNYILRFDYNRNLDSSFNSGVGPNNSINFIVLQSDKKILIGGDFTSYDGVVRNHIARLNPDGTIDTSFDPGTGANNSVTSIVIDSIGKILIGGDFTEYNGISRNHIARLNSDGTIDTSFDLGTGANNLVKSLVIDSIGKILIGGDFTDYNGINRNHIARLNSDGSIDTTFNPGFGANNSVRSICVDSVGKILIGGDFTFYSGMERNHIAKLNSDGTLDTSFNPMDGTNDIIYSIALQADGKILIGGNFTSFNGTNRKYIARLNDNGSIDGSFNPSLYGPYNYIEVMALQPDKKILISGQFMYKNYGRGSLIRLNSDGTIDNTFNSKGANTDAEFSFSGLIHCMLVQPDGKILIGGAFISYNNVARNGIARLNPDGTLDYSFNPGTGGAEIHSLALQPDGKILIGGTFTSYNGTTKNGIARLKSDGKLDESFNTILSDYHPDVRSIVVQSDSKILIGGLFVINGLNRIILRLNANGSLDKSFSIKEAWNSEVYAIAVQPDNKILIGGKVLYYDGIKKSYVVRLNSNGTLDNSFVSARTVGIYFPVYSIVVQSDQKILVGGSGFNRLNTDGTVDSVFTINQGSGKNADVSPVILQPDGNILIAGHFYSYNGIKKSQVCRIIGDSPNICSNFQLTFTDVVDTICSQNIGSATAIAFFGKHPYKYNWVNSSVINDSVVLFNSSKVYEATVLDGNGCADTASITIENPFPVITIPNQTICKGDSVIFDAGSGFKTYLWSGNGVGVSQISKGIKAGNYTCEVTNANGCKASATGSLTVSVCDTSKIEISEISPSISNLYPNPTTGDVTLKLSVTETCLVEISVCDILGQKVMSESINLISGQNQIPLFTSSLSNGVYLVKINSSSLQSTFSLVMQK